MKNAPQPFGAKVLNIADFKKLPFEVVEKQTADLLEEGLRMMRILECNDDASILIVANEIRNERVRLGCQKYSREIYTHARNLLDLIRGMQNA